MTRLILLLSLLALPVFAQPTDGGVDPLLSDLSTVVQTANEASHKGVAGWLVFIVTALALVTKVLIRFGKMLPAKVGAWFATPIATWVLPFVLSILGALSTALASGQPLSFGLFAGAIMAGMAAGGIGSVPAFKEQQLKKADEAGAEAAAKVVTPADAANVFRNQGPRP